MKGAASLPLPGGERVGVRGNRLTKVGRGLRRRMTDAEQKLWLELRDRRLNGLKFKRQAPIGDFVADFACLEHHVIVEVDGGQHVAKAATDAERTAKLQAMGYVVLRFWNHEVLKEMDGVLAAILLVIDNLGPVPPHPSPLPSGERGRVPFRADADPGEARNALPRPGGERVRVRGDRAPRKRLLP